MTNVEMDCMLHLHNIICETPSYNTTHKAAIIFHALGIKIRRYACPDPPHLESTGSCGFVQTRVPIVSLVKNEAVRFIG